jgi:hypothetical protein
MVKRCAILFGVLGYLLVVWFYIVSPNEHTLRILSFACPACPIIETVGPTSLVYLVVFAPMNALIYAGAGFLLGKLILTLRSNRHTHP